MKAVTLIQPWATLVMLGIKQHETRSWSTNYRGPLLIHASAKLHDEDGLWLWHQLYERNELPEEAKSFMHLPRGAVLGSVRLESVHLAQRVSPTCEDVELLCGDFEPGRFAWWLTEAIQFAQPIPAKGALGLWNFKGELPS